MSPLLHDYKPSARPQVKKFSALHWFAVGLGLPLFGIALLLSLKKASGTGVADTAVEVPQTTAMAISSTIALNAVANNAADIDPELAPLMTEPQSTAAGAATAALAEVVTEEKFHPPLQLAPEYEKLQLTIKRGDTLDRLFRRNDLDLGDLAAIVLLPEATAHLRKLIPGDEFLIEHDEGKLISVYRELDLTSAMKISRKDSKFVTQILERPIEIRKKLAYGRIESSLFESAVQAGLPDKLIMNLAGIYAWDVDFVFDIRSGDDYYILFEEIYQDGKYVSDGEIIAAEFNNRGRSIQAIRYADKEGRSDYYTPKGRSVRKAFVRAPVDFTRISSNFNPRRKHPILNTIRAHRGVDYAASSGTPIKAAGDGKVIFRGVKSGYGNAVIVQHGGNITTLYAHMSRIDKSSRVGQRVVQGQTIGYVGMSGLATAPHLHYEYRVNGVHRNPRTVDLPQAEPIQDEYRSDFVAATEPILKELMRYKRTQVASAPVD